MKASPWLLSVLLLAGCSSKNSSCPALVNTWHLAEAARQAAQDEATLSVSPGGVEVTDAEAAIITAAINAQADARDSADRAGCL